jgi:SHS2 domain-containing protein
MENQVKKFEFLEHPSELKIRSFGKGLPDVFVNSALAMMEFLFGKVPKSKIQYERLEVNANNLESLLVDWLAEILYLSNSKKRIYQNYKVLEFSDRKIIADVGSQKALAKDDIKAVTYHELSISKQNGLWQATVVYDI